MIIFLNVHATPILLPHITSLSISYICVYMYWVGQKSSFEFSHRVYGKTQQTFWPTLTIKTLISTVPL